MVWQLISYESFLHVGFSLHSKVSTLEMDSYWPTAQSRVNYASYNAVFDLSLFSFYLLPLLSLTVQLTAKVADWLTELTGKMWQRRPSPSHFPWCSVLHWFETEQRWSTQHPAHFACQKMASPFVLLKVCVCVCWTVNKLCGSPESLKPWARRPDECVCVCVSE